jgi:XTP/dITP diphosphohydrolase
MDRLRSPGGCPWDAKQTHRSLMPYLLEEAYEVYDALERDDLEHLREELGDLLLQVVFHARIASESGWGIDEVAGDLVDKLVRRHPHVFAGASADDLEGSWEALKAAEKGRVSVTEGVPLGQPALSLAAKLQRRAARIGAPVPPGDGSLGGQLWDLVAACTEAGVDPEVALREVARDFRDRLAAAEAAGEWSALERPLGPGVDGSA